jgi:hypothetical protein
MCYFVKLNKGKLPHAPFKDKPPLSEPGRDVIDIVDVMIADVHNTPMGRSSSHKN